MKEFIKKILISFQAWYYNNKFTLIDSDEDILKLEKREKEKSKFRKIIEKLVFIIFVIILVLWLFGCAPRVQIEYKPVYIPTKCIIDYPVKPMPTGNVLQDNLNILEYSERLKLSLKACKE